MIDVPGIIRTASGIKIFGKRLKSFVFTTDIAVIKNNNADAIMAVYPFTPQPVITEVLVSASDVPVFCGVGGGKGKAIRPLYQGLNSAPSVEELPMPRIALDAHVRGLHCLYHSTLKRISHTGQVNRRKG